MRQHAHPFMPLIHPAHPLQAAHMLGHVCVKRKVREDRVMQIANEIAWRKRTFGGGLKIRKAMELNPNLVEGIA